MKKTNALLVLVLALLLTGLSACGSPPRSVQTASGDGSTPLATAGTVPSTSTALALIRTDDGLAAVRPDTGSTVWSADEAVSAPDGSAVFRTEVDPNPTTIEGVRGRTVADGVPLHTRIVRLDPRTGDEVGSWSVTHFRPLTIATIAPDGRWVALTDRVWGEAPDAGRQVTNLVVFDPTRGDEVNRLSFRGDVEPEAFSTDGQQLFALTYVGDHYRVQTIDVATGVQTDVLAREKTPGEDMDGTAVQATLSADRTLLSTLYRNPGDAGEPAFVHVLDLTNGWSHCADLPAPFGTGAVGSDLLTTSPSGALLVADDAGTVAEIDVESVHDPDPRISIAVDVRAEPGAVALPAAIRAVGGFRQYVTTLP
jgi:hypothetical protein